MPASTSRTPWSTFSGVSRLMRPSSSSSPQSPQVEPGGRCFHRFVTAAPSAARCSVPTGWLSLCTGSRTREHVSASGGRRMTQQGLRRLRRTGTSSSPPTCSRPASRSTCATGRCGRRTSRSSRSSRAAPAIFRRLHTPGYEGWTISRYRQTGGRMPEGDPEHILEDMDLDGVDVQVMHPNLSLFGLYSDDHELSMAHARVYNDYVVERFTPYFDRARAHRARADHRHRRRRRRDRAGRRGRVPGDPPAGDPADARTTRATSTRCGPRRRPTACTCSSTPRPAA